MNILSGLISAEQEDEFGAQSAWAEGKGTEGSRGQTYQDGGIEAP